MTVSVRGRCAANSARCGGLSRYGRIALGNDVGACGPPRRGTGEVGLQVLQPERHLVRVELLGATAKLRTLELPDDQAQPVDLGLPLAQRTGQITHELLQRLRVGRQGIERDPHGDTIAAQAEGYNVERRSTGNHQPSCLHRRSPLQPFQ